MPGSHYHQINEITEIMVCLQPQSILDIGVGFGKYAVLAREQLDLWEGEGKSKGDYARWIRRIDGIEACSHYLTPLHSFVYDRIYLGEAQAVVDTLIERYDLILLIDVLEHLERRVGLELLQALERIGRNILVSTPHHVGSQGPLYENNFERHISQWQASDFRSFPNRVLVPNDASLIYLIGEGVPRVARLIKQKQRQLIKSALKILFPSLVRPYRLIKSLTNRQ